MTDDLTHDFAGGSCRECGEPYATDTRKACCPTRVDRALAARDLEITRAHERADDAEAMRREREDLDEIREILDSANVPTTATHLSGTVPLSIPSRVIEWADRLREERDTERARAERAERALAAHVAAVNAQRDNIVEAWHTGCTGTLAETLGMTDAEYAAWVENPNHAAGDALDAQIAHARQEERAAIARDLETTADAYAHAEASDERLSSIFRQRARRVRTGAHLEPR